MVTALLLVVAGLLVVCVGLLVSLHRRPSGDPVAALSPRLDFIERGNERTEGALREELAKTREESGQTAHHLREEITGSLERLS